jgi:hypothetical protein
MVLKLTYQDLWFQKIFRGYTPDPVKKAREWKGRRREERIREMDERK